MALTSKQEKFAIEVSSGVNISDAYRNAYNTSNMSSDSINREAHELMKNPKISARVEELKRPIIEAAQFTHESLVADLIEIKDRCMQKVPVMVRVKGELVQAQDEEGNNLWTFDANAAIKAITELGKHDGKFYEKNNRDKAGTKSIDEMLAIREQLKQKYKE